MLGVSRTTVRAALQSLADDGIVSRRRRHGTVVNRHVLRSLDGPQPARARSAR